MLNSTIFDATFLSLVICIAFVLVVGYILLDAGYRVAALFVWMCGILFSLYMASLL